MDPAVEFARRQVIRTIIDHVRLRDQFEAIPHSYLLSEKPSTSGAKGTLIQIKRDHDCGSQSGTDGKAPGSARSATMIKSVGRGTHGSPVDLGVRIVLRPRGLH